MSFESLTVGELQEALEEALHRGMATKDTLVTVGVDYGDRIHTTQAIPFGEVNPVLVRPTSYSTSGFCIVPEDQEDDMDFDHDKDPVLCLNAGCY